MKTSAVNQYNPRGQSNLTLNSDMNILEKHDLLFHIRSATTSDKTLLAEGGSETFYDSFEAENTPPADGKSRQGG